jgi:hypothetical protein
MKNINTVTANYVHGNLVSYQVTFSGSNMVFSVPKDEANTDYQAILEWVANGGTIIDSGE